MDALYVYSFLDVREGILGKKFLAEVQRQLGEALAADGVKSKQLWFENSPLRNDFSLAAVGQNPASTAMRIPVEEVIKANQGDDASFGSTHRLLALPASVTSTNTSIHFMVRWVLIDAQTNKVQWSTSSASNEMRWFLGDENPVGRAKDFVDGLMVELRKSGAILKN